MNTKNEAIFLLRRMVEKAFCNHTIGNAYGIWRKLDYPIPSEWCDKIRTELWHAEHEGVQGKLALKDVVEEYISTLE